MEFFYCIYVATLAGKVQVVDGPADRPIIIHDDVARLQVPMHDFTAVNEFNSREQLVSQRAERIQEGRNTLLVLFF